MSFAELAEAKDLARLSTAELYRRRVSDPSLKSACAAVHRPGARVHTNASSDAINRPLDDLKGSNLPRLDLEIQAASIARHVCDPVSEQIGFGAPSHRECQFH